VESASACTRLTWQTVVEGATSSHPAAARAKTLRSLRLIFSQLTRTAERFLDMRGCLESIRAASRNRFFFAGVWAH